MRHVALSMVAIGIVAQGCGQAGAPRTPIPAGAPEVPRASAPSPEAKPTAPPGDPESDWHTFDPEPLPSTASLPKRLYPLVAWSGMAWGHGCGVARGAGSAFVLCAHDLARIDGRSLDRAYIDPIPLGRDEPAYVTGTPDDLWVRTTDGGDGATDALSDRIGAWAHWDGARWSRLETQGERHPYRGGVILPDLPLAPPRGVKGADLEQCLARGCTGVFLKFSSPTARAVPDLSAIAAKVAWVHRARDHDYAYAVDPEGPAYVVFVARDVRSKRQALGMAWWTEASGARFAWAPTGIAKLGSAVFVGSAEASKGRASFAVWPQGGEGKAWTLSFDGRAWSASERTLTEADTSPLVRVRKQEEEASRAEAAAIEAREGIRKNESTNRLEIRDAKGKWVAIDLGYDQVNELVDLGPGEVVVRTTQHLYSTLQPRERFEQTERWGRIHAWPRAATDGCQHPFAIVDARPEAEYAQRLAELRAAKARAAAEDDEDLAAFGIEWGRLAEEDASSVSLVEVRVDGQVLIGAPFPTVAAAQAFMQRTPEWDAGHLLDSARVVCARVPSTARPFPG